MKETRIIMGMPVTVEIIASKSGIVESVPKTLERAFDYFTYVDNKFSTYKIDSEIMRINRGEVSLEGSSRDMQEIFHLAEATQKETGGYFDIINRKGIFDPSGIVKGWAINNVANLIKEYGFENYYVEAGGDIQVGGKNSAGQKWKVGIENPFEQGKFVKVVYLSDQGIATSGTYIRGQHIYNPKDKEKDITEIVSLTVIGPDIYEADRFATSAFAMGKAGIYLIEKQKGLEGYIIDSNGNAMMTSGFEIYTTNN
jgi:thiamine biosynthesis lipoprotein